MLNVLVIPVLVAAAESASMPVLPVKDLNRAYTFWKEKLGIPLEKTGEAALPDRAGGRVLVTAVNKEKGIAVLFAVDATWTGSRRGAVPPPPAAYIELPEVGSVKAAFPNAPSVTVGERCYLFIKDPDGNGLCVAGPLARAISLFNGKDLTGWHLFRKASWEADEGVLVGEQGPNNTGGWLVTDAAYGDFTLTLSLKISRGANSGVCVRYPGEGPPPKVGAEIQFCEVDPDYQTGSILNEQKAPQGIYRSGWNTATVIVAGKKITSILNGKQVATATVDRLKPKGHIALQIHGGAQYAGTFVEFKDIKLVKKEPGES